MLCNIFAVAYASEFSNFESVRRMAVSAPRARHLRSVDSVSCVPMVMAVTVPPCFSFMRTASSSA